MCVDPGPIFVVDEVISFISAVGQFRILGVDRLQEAGLEGVAVDFLSVDVEGVELMVPLNTLFLCVNPPHQF
jgi:hypothetical protein